MPGLAGTIASLPDPGISTRFEQILGPMRRDRLLVESQCDANHRWALGRLHLGVLQPKPQLSNGSPVKVLFHGDLHNEQELRAMVAQKTDATGASGVPGLLGAVYREIGPAVASLLKGAFCAAIFDGPECRVLLISDLLGSCPLYWFRTPDRFVFASELKAVLRDPAVPRALDRRAVADYVKLGFVCGNRTLAEGVQVLAPGSVLTYCWRDGTCRIEKHHHLANLFSTVDESKAERLEKLNAAFTEAVRRAQSGGHRAGLALSGGLDTRAILSALNPSSGPVSTYTLGVRGCADHVIADRLSRIAGTRHSFFELNGQYLSNFLPNLRQMVSLTDGMYLSHGLTEMLALNHLENSGIEVLLRGHCGEVAKSRLAWPFHVDEQVRELRTREELLPYLLDRVIHVTAAPVRELFAPEWRDVIEFGPAASLNESIRDVSLPLPDLCTYLYLQELHRRFTAPSLEIFRSRLEVRLPFADEDFLRELLSTPSHWREDTGIHRRLIRRDLLGVRNSNTGAPADAGPVRELVQDKLNSIFKRLNIHGYRHYHAFDAWLKTQVVDSVEDVLLEPQAFARGMLRESVLRRWIADARNGSTASGYLFQVLLNIELWQRENLQ